MIKRASGTNEYVHTLWAGCNVALTIKWGGYDDPGKTYGPPDNCYPAESDIEWEVLKAEITNDDGVTLFTLPNPTDSGDLTCDLYETITAQCWEWFEETDTGDYPDDEEDL